MAGPNFVRVKFEMTELTNTITEHGVTDDKGRAVGTIQTKCARKAIARASPGGPVMHLDVWRSLGRLKYQFGIRTASTRGGRMYNGKENWRWFPTAAERDAAAKEALENSQCRLIKKWGKIE